MPLFGARTFLSLKRSDKAVCDAKIIFKYHLLIRNVLLIEHFDRQKYFFMGVRAGIPL
jgi:hypothetical protein